MIEKFELGKTYINSVKTKVVCVGTDCGVYIFKYADDRIPCDRKYFGISKPYIDDYKEYKEPIVHTRYIHWYKNKKSDQIDIVISISENPWYARGLDYFTHIKTTKDTCSVEG